MIGFYVENKIQWADKFRTVLALRGDEARYDVTNLTPSYTATELPGAPVVNFAAANSGTVTKFLPEPKASLIFGPWSKTEFYVQGGFSFHSNDARGATQREEPISPDNPFPTATSRIPALIQTKGAEIGVRTTAFSHLQSTFSLWYLHSAIRTAAGWRHRRHECFIKSEQPLWHRMGELLHAAGTLGF